MGNRSRLGASGFLLRCIALTISALRVPPVALGVALGCLLQLAHTFRILDPLSANAGTPGYDFFGLPRCGIALREGLAIADSWKTVPFGPYSTDWASHPMLCLAFGAPLSFLGPWGAYWTFGAFLSILQIATMVVCAHAARLPEHWREFDARTKARILVVHVCCGLFFPMYVLLNQGQYHGLSILWVLLLLGGRQGEFWGFAGSALSKPILAPAALIPVLRGDWRLVAGVMLTVGTVTSALTAWEKWHHGASSLGSLGEGGWLKLKYSVMHWNQEISLSKVLERFFDAETNFHIRAGFAVACLLVAAAWSRREGGRAPAVAACLLSVSLLYARGHEYHAVTFLPVLLALGNQKEWLRWDFLVAVVLLALPTSWPLMAAYRLPGAPFETNHMLASNPVLGWAFVVQKPLAHLLMLMCLGRALFDGRGKTSRAVS